MRTKVVLIVAAIVMLIISTVAIGSNMGFKIVVQLNTGTYANNWVSLPYYNSYTNADSVKQDIGPACIQVSRWNQSSGTFDTWTGRGNNFTLIAGEAIMVRVNAPTNWIVVGSHNPTLGLSLATGTYANNWISVPYHTTSVNADGIKQAVGANCIQVSRWNQVTGTFDTWTGRGNNFTLTPGEGVMVRVNAPTNWTPAHY